LVGAAAGERSEPGGGRQSIAKFRSTNDDTALIMFAALTRARETSADSSEL
jgi:hypothetical protein